MRIAVEAAGAAVDDVTKITWYVVGYRPEWLPELVAAMRCSAGICQRARWSA